MCERLFFFTNCSFAALCSSVHQLVTKPISMAAENLNLLMRTAASTSSLLQTAVHSVCKHKHTTHYFLNHLLYKLSSKRGITHLVYTALQLQFLTLQWAAETHHFTVKHTLIHFAAIMRALFEQCHSETKLITQSNWIYLTGSQKLKRN